MSGPLEGIRVVELGGIGPGPFACMLLADLGADVLRIDRPGYREIEDDSVLLRGRPRLFVDLKSAAGHAFVMALLERADVLIEGYRPGVAEKLGLVPDSLHGIHPRLVYTRVTGWGQTGPEARRAGHDINYLAASGLLATVGRSGEPPVAPVNYLGDYAAGGMLAVIGICAALVERAASGRGQVVDAAMVDGCALMLGDVLGALQAGRWNPGRGTNGFDGGSHFYEVYETKDGKHMAVGAFEPQFYAAVLEGLGLQEDPDDQFDATRWPAMKQHFTRVFATKTQSEWTEVFADRDACVTPVMDPRLGHQHPQLDARQTYVVMDGRVEPNVAPRFSRSPGELRSDTPDPAATLEGWGVSPPAELLS